VVLRQLGMGRGCVIFRQTQKAMGMAIIHGEIRLFGVFPVLSYKRDSPVNLIRKIGLVAYLDVSFQLTPYITVYPLILAPNLIITILGPDHYVYCYYFCIFLILSLSGNLTWHAGKSTI